MRSLLIVAAVVLVTGVPAWAQTITAQKNSGNFTYQYNGDTVPTTTGGLGTTGYGTGTIAGDILNITLSTEGNILEKTPTSDGNTCTQFPGNYCTIFSFASTIWAGIGETFIESGDTWNTLINNSTGNTWEIRMRQKTTAELPPIALPGILANLNRFSVVVGDSTNGSVFAIEANGLMYPAGGGFVIPIANQDGQLHTYRLATGPDTDQTDVWFDDTYIGTYTGMANFRDHKWGMAFGWTTGWEIDYVRWEVGGFAPGDLVVLDSDYNGDGSVDAANYVICARVQKTTAAIRTATTRGAPIMV